MSAPIEILNSASHSAIPLKRISERYKTYTQATNISFNNDVCLSHSLQNFQEALDLLKKLPDDDDKQVQNAEALLQDPNFPDEHTLTQLARNLIDEDAI